MKDVSGQYAKTNFHPMKILLLRYRSAPEHYPISQELFRKRNLNYELRHPQQLPIPKVINVYDMSESIACSGAKVWHMLPNKLKNISSRSIFKNAIKE